jgi:hypothetical protein
VANPALIEWSISLGELVVGLGTLTLAAVTWQLAKSSAASVEALDMPFLLGQPDYQGTFNYRPVNPDEENPEDFEWAFSFELVNIGAGPGILDGIRLNDDSTGQSWVSTDWNIDRLVPAEDEPFNVGVPLRGDPTVGLEDFTLQVLYRSASGNRYSTVHAMRQTKNLGARRLSFERRKIVSD